MYKFLTKIFQHEIDHLNGIHMLNKAKRLEPNEYYLDFMEKNKDNPNINIFELD